jgi:anti-anti-sigma factor
VCNSHRQHHLENAAEAEGEAHGRLVVTVQIGENAVPTVVATGEIDLSTSALIATAIEQALEGAPPTIAFDLGGVTFIDSSGLAQLITAARQAEVLVLNPSRPVRRIIELTGLSTILLMPT